MRAPWPREPEPEWRLEGRDSATEDGMRDMVGWLFGFLMLLIAVSILGACGTVSKGCYGSFFMEVGLVQIWNIVEGRMGFFDDISAYISTSREH